MSSVLGLSLLRSAQEMFLSLRALDFIADRQGVILKDSASGGHRQAGILASSRTAWFETSGTRTSRLRRRN